MLTIDESENKELVKKGRVYIALNKLIESLAAESPIKEKLIEYEVNEIQHLKSRNILGLVTEEEQRIAFNYTGFLVLKICSLIENNDEEGLEKLSINKEDLGEIMVKIIHFEKEIISLENEWRWKKESFKIPPPLFYVNDDYGKVVPKIESIMAEGMTILIIGLIAVYFFITKFGFPLSSIIGVIIFWLPSIYKFMKKLNHAKRYEKAYQSHVKGIQIYQQHLGELKEKLNWKDFYR